MRSLLLCIIGACGVVALGVFLLTPTTPGNVHIPANPLEARTIWEQTIKKYGPNTAYDVFLDANANDAARRSEHLNAHVFGEALYLTHGMAGIEYCGDEFDFGCFHGFAEHAITSEGVEAIDGLDTHCKKKGAEYFPCQHGLGHGILSHVGANRIEDALSLCATISNRTDSAGCFSGIFMEYNFPIMDEDTEAFFRSTGASLHEPCNSISERFQSGCYAEQPQWWGEVLEEDWGKARALCDEVPEYARVACYGGLGKYAAWFARPDITNVREAVTDACMSTINTSLQYICVHGAAWNEAGERGIDIGHAICDLLMGAPRQECLDSLTKGYAFK